MCSRTNYTNNIKSCGMIKKRTTIKLNIIILCTILILGGALRTGACFWGFPYTLHPDESLVVQRSIEMIRNHSYIADSFERPDQLAIKVCAVLFQIYSYITYHVSAATEFNKHSIDFYIIARLVTTVFGVLSIFLAYKATEILSSRMKFVGAAMVAFFPLFIQHSAYATPDIVLTFFVILTAYISLLYMNNPSIKYLVLMSISVGLGLTVKYTCSISCIYIGIIILVECIVRKKYLEIVKRGILSIIIVASTSLLCAPNVFTDLPRVLKIIKRADGSFHGSDGLGFLGNLVFYVKTFLDTVGYEASIFILCGLFVAVLSKKKEFLFFAMGLLFLICTSLISQHWVRYAMPFYIFFLLLIVLGFNYLYGITKYRFVQIPALILGGVVFLNCFFSSLLLVQSTLTPEARVDAIRFCKANGITIQNSLFDGYSPLCLGGPKWVQVTLDKDENLVVPSGVKYVVISSMMYNRYYTDPVRFKQKYKIYQKIQDNKNLLYSAGGSYYGYNNYNNYQFGIDGSYYRHNNFATINIYEAIKGLLAHNSDSVVGPTIKIYRLDGSDK